MASWGVYLKLFTKQEIKQSFLFWPLAAKQATLIANPKKADNNNNGNQLDAAAGSRAAFLVSLVDFDFDLDVG